MKFYMSFLLVTVAFGAASAGYIGGGGWSPGYAGVAYAPSYTGWNSGWSGGLSGYGGWNKGWSGNPGWNKGWSSGWTGGWW